MNCRSRSRSRGPELNQDDGHNDGQVACKNRGRTDAEAVERNLARENDTVAQFRDESLDIDMRVSSQEDAEFPENTEMSDEGEIMDQDYVEQRSEVDSEIEFQG